MSDWWKRVLAGIDLRDVVIFIGLILLAVGFWQVWVPLAFIVPGVIIVAVAIFGAPGANDAGE